MIFNKGLDKSLWYILEADVENRNNIINLLNSLPSTFKATILKAMKYVDSEFEKGNKDLSLEYKCDEANDGHIYFAEIDTNWEEKCLNIKQELIDPSDLGCDGINFATELYLIEVMQEYPGIEDEIANFSYSVSLISKHQKLKSGFTPYFKLENGKVKHIGQSKTYEYEYLLSKSKEEVRINKMQIHAEPNTVQVNIDEIPEDLTMEYIDDKYSNSKGSSFSKQKN